MTDKPKPDDDIALHQRIGLRDKEGTIIDDRGQMLFLDVPLNLDAKKKRGRRDAGPTLWD